MERFWFGVVLLTLLAGAFGLFSSRRGLRRELDQAQPPGEPKQQEKPEAHLEESTLPSVSWGLPSRVFAPLLVAFLTLAGAIFYYQQGRWDELELAELTTQALAGDELASAELADLLSQRLAEEPDAADLWMLHGLNLKNNGMLAEAVEAYERVREIGGDDPLLLTHLSLARWELEGASPATLKLLTRGAALAPANPIFPELMALAAFTKGDYERVLKMLQQALDLGVDPKRAELLRQGVAEARKRLASQVAGAEEGSEIGIEVEVRLDPELQLPTNAAVFVFVRTADSRGPPLAAVRQQVGDLPMRVHLGPEQAIIPGFNLGAEELVQVAARVALSGTPGGAPGDFEALSEPFDPRTSSAMVQLLIGPENLLSEPR